jgi:HrpA-like RNA helicase
MSYVTIITDVVTNNIFPQLDPTERTNIITYMIEVIKKIEQELKPEQLVEQLSANNYKDIYILVNMIVPFIEEEKKPKLKFLKEIPKRFTNLSYNLGETYEYGIEDIKKAKEHLVKNTIPKVINNLYINWVDIFPDIGDDKKYDNNNHFLSKIKFMPDILNKKDKDILYAEIQKNIRNNYEKWKHAIYYFLSSVENPVTYDDISKKLITKKAKEKAKAKQNITQDEYSVKYTKDDDGKELSKTDDLMKQFYHLDKKIIKKSQNWFESETFYWLSQIHFYNHFLANRVIFMTAGTGVGKSTHIPKLALYSLMAFEGVEEPKVIVTQPRQTPAEGVPKYISKGMGISIENYDENLKKNKIDTEDSSPFYIQYHHGNNKHISENQKKKKNNNHRIIKYVTDQLLYNELLENISLIENGETLYDIIMIDEAHEHNIRMDLLLSLLKTTLQLNPKIRLMIISATMEDDEGRYRQFFNSIEDTITQGTQQNLLSSSIDRRLHVANPLQKNKFNIIEKFEKKPVEDYIESGINKIKTILKEYSKGDILFFLTGMGDIIKVAEQLNKELPSYIITLPLYSQLEKKRQLYATDFLPKDVPISRESATIPLKDQINDSLGKYTQKIVLATTIAEASVTIENLKFVIDIGFSKSPLYDTEKKIDVIESTAISMSSHTQRRGRVGRIADGYAFYLYTREDVINQKIIADIKTNNLCDNIYSLLKNNVDDKKGFEKELLLDKNGEFYIVHPEDDHNIRKFDGTFKEPIKDVDNKYIIDAFEHLEELKLIDKNGYKTKLGQFVNDNFTISELSKISIQDRLAIFYGIHHDCLNPKNNIIECILFIITFISTTSFDKFFTNLRLGLIKFCKNSSDHMCIINIFSNFFKYTESKLIICKYSKKILIDELNDIKKNINKEENEKSNKDDDKEDKNKLEKNENIKKFLKKYKHYFDRFDIKLKNDGSDFDENLYILIYKEQDLISKWCESNYINSIFIIKILEKYNLFKKDVKTVSDKYKKIKIIHSINSFNSLDLYYKIIRIFVMSNPRNIGIVGPDGIYQSKYNLLLSVKTKFVREIKKVLPVSCYNKNSRYIFFSQIGEFNDEYSISFISHLNYNPFSK